VAVITLGTGIGTALFRDGVLLPYTELGHLEIGGEDAEFSAAESARERNGWSWQRWARSVDRYLARLEYLLGVDLFIIGGGAVSKAHRFLPHLEQVTCEVVPAQTGNLAGIIGAARFAADTF
jgi:polyphosphate glucokinase